MIAAAAALLLQAAAPSELRPGLVSSLDTNLRFALREACLPWVRDGEDRLSKGGWGISAVGWGPQRIFKRVGAKAHMIGTTGRVNVGVYTNASGGRACEIEVNRGHPGEARRTLLDEAARLPDGFQAARTPYTANDYAFRDTLCARAPSSTAILMSTTAEGARLQPILLATVVAASERQWRCDREGPPANYPTPASPPP